MIIKIAKTEAEVQKCWDVFSLLRPHLTEEVFVETVIEMLSEGYQLAYIEVDGEVVSAVGFRYLQMLYNGKQIYIDDLTTSDKVRGKGYGTALLDYVIELAKANNYDCVTLDSGPTRHTAHRLYLNKGFQISSHHFVKKLH
jgi:GNAT superfamily N-acetyltransferase